MPIIILFIFWTFLVPKPAYYCNMLNEKIRQNTKIWSCAAIISMHGFQICAGKGPPQEASRRPRRRSRLQISILSCSGNRLSDLKILIDTKCDLRLCGKYRCVAKIAFQIPRLLIEKQNATWGFEQFLIIMYFSKRAFCPRNIF